MNEFIFKGFIEKRIDRSGTKKDGTPFTAFDYIIRERSDRYPQAVVASTFGDKIAPVEEGAEVTAHLSMDVREYQDRYFQQIRMWKCEIDKEAPAPQPSAADDDLPF